MSPQETDFLTKEIDKLLKHGVIEKCQHEPGEVISPIFLREKSDGGFRMILNLKHLNEDVVYRHFKMETLLSIINLVDKDCFMTKVDIRNAYYSIKIDPTFQKYFKFMVGNELFRFTCLPNGLSPGPRLFTKVMKPPMGTLRKWKVILAIYIDDILNLHRSKLVCQKNTGLIIDLLTSLGFFINYEKSDMNPSKVMEFLGYIINTSDMTLQLTMKKKNKILSLCDHVLKTKKRIQIRTVAKLLGKMTSSFPGVKYGPLHYRCLDMDKTAALTKAAGNYNSYMKISEGGLKDIEWWLDNILSSYNHFSLPDPTLLITTDACDTGWGGKFKDREAHGGWTAQEIEQFIIKQKNINVFELKAILYSFKTIMTDVRDTHIKVLSDNTTAVQTVNKMGTSRSRSCNSVVREIWDWLISQNNWVTVSYIPGVYNEEADALSRLNETSSEWMLDPHVFNNIMSHFQFKPEIDLFATRVNKQINQFVSYGPDPDSTHVNAFTLDWSELKFYAFPPFICIGRTARKIINNQATGILVTPNWETQYWFSLVERIAIQPPFIISSRSDLLRLPNHPDLQHPLAKNLELVAWKVSGSA